MIKYILAIAFLFSIIELTAQIQPEKSIELDLNDDFYGEELFPFGEDGFILTSSRREQTAYETKILKFNKNLELSDSILVQRDRKYKSSDLVHTDDKILILNSDKLGFFEILTIDSKTLSIDKVEGRLPRKFYKYLLKPEVFKEFFMWDISTKKEKLIYLLNWKTGEEIIIPIKIDLYKSKKIYDLNLQILESSEEFLVTCNVSIARKKSHKYAMIYDEAGENQLTINLGIETENDLKEITGEKLAKGKYLFSGTYATSTRGSSIGMFVLEFENKKINFFQFYPFVDFKNFLDYASERTQEKIEKKKKRKKRKGKEFNIPSNIIGHDVIELNDGFIYIGESYIATYRTETRTSTTYLNGVASTTTTYVQVFDGYLYTHAVIVKFDKNGSKIWDECFPMSAPYKPWRPIKFLKIDNSDDKVNIALISGLSLQKKSYDYSGVLISESTSDEIDILKESEKVKSVNSVIEPWYDEKYLAYGSLITKDKEAKRGEKKKKTFFVHSIIVK